MLNCDRCGCEGRVARVCEEAGGETGAPGAWVQYLCANPACENNRRIFGEEWLEMGEDVAPQREAEPTDG